MRSGEREIAGIDDLFAAAAEPTADEEPVEQPERRPSVWPRLLRNALLIAAATTVTVAGLHSQGVRVSLVLVIAAFVALRLLMLAVATVAAPPPPRSTAASRPVEDGFYRWGSGDLLRVAVRRWEQRLGAAQSDPELLSRTLVPVLAELTDERLRLRHGITRAADPRRARELTGEPLWALVSGQVRRLKAKDLTGYVEALERL